MTEYKGAARLTSVGLTTVHISEASKLVESIRSETEQLKKKVLEVSVTLLGLTLAPWQI